jgi:hypothetical protein
MQRDFRSDRKYDPSRIREPRQVGSMLWKPMSIRTEYDDEQIDSQEQKMKEWMRQENIVLMATEDKKPNPNQESKKTKNDETNHPRGVADDKPRPKAIGRGAMLAKKKVNQPPPVGIPAAEERRPQPVQQPPQPTHLHEPNTPSYAASDQSTASSSSSSPVKPAGVAPPSGEAKRPIGRGRGRGRMTQ